MGFRRIILGVRHWSRTVFSGRPVSGSSGPSGGYFRWLCRRRTFACDCAYICDRPRRSSDCTHGCDRTGRGGVCHYAPNRSWRCVHSVDNLPFPFALPTAVSTLLNQSLLPLGWLLRPSMVHHGRRSSPPAHITALGFGGCAQSIDPAIEARFAFLLRIAAIKRPLAGGGAGPSVPSSASARTPDLCLPVSPYILGSFLPYHAEPSPLDQGSRVPCCPFRCTTRRGVFA